MAANVCPPYQDLSFQSHSFTSGQFPPFGSLRPSLGSLMFAKDEAKPDVKVVFESPALQALHPAAPPVQRVIQVPPVSSAEPSSDQLKIAIVCNGNRGVFLIATQTVLCSCSVCSHREFRKFGITPTEFERHSGLGTAKKWRNSIKVEGGDNSLTIGRWLEQNNLSGPPSGRKNSDHSEKRISTTSEGAGDCKGVLHQDTTKYRMSQSPERQEPPNKPVELRVGDEFQAVLPVPLPKPSADDYECVMRKYAVPGPSEEEAMEVAAKTEKPAAEQLPRDAIDDIDESCEDTRPKVEIRPDRILRSRNRQVAQLQPTNNSGTACDDSDHQAAPSSAGDLGQGVRGSEGEAALPSDADIAVIVGAKRRAMEEAMNQIADAESAETEPQHKKQNLGSGRPVVSAWRILQPENRLKVTVLINGLSFSGVLAPSKTIPHPRGPRTQHAVPQQQSVVQKKPIHSNHTTAAHVVTSHLLDRQRHPVNTQPQQETLPDRLQASAVADPLQSQDDPNVSALPPQDLCALCHQPAEANTSDCNSMQTSTKRNASGSSGPRITFRPAGQSCSNWVHQQCALWSPEVYVIGDDICNIDSAVQRGQRAVCSRCHQRGGTISCTRRNCHNVFHLHCAREEGCSLIGEPYSVTCRGHCGNQPKTADGNMSRQASEEMMYEYANGEGAAGGPYSFGGASSMQRASSGDGTGLLERPRAIRATAPKLNYADMVKGTALPPAQRVVSAPASRVRVHSSSGAGCGTRPGQNDGSIPDAAPRLGLPPLSKDVSNINSVSNREMGSTKDMDYTPEAEAELALSVAEALAMGHQAAVQSARANLVAALNPSSAPQHHQAPAASRVQPVFPASMDGPGRMLTQSAEPGTSQETNTRSRAPSVDRMEVDSECDLATLALLGGTTGQPGRAGRCSVCVVQRKGKCGTESAPKKCLRRQYLQMRNMQIPPA